MDLQKEKSLKASLERLMNQKEQAKLNGDTKLVKQIEQIINRIKYGKK
jgi:hypothetical protein